MEVFFGAMDEIIDILNTNGELTGTTAMKSEAHRKGWFHQTVHIWFYTSDRKVLLQQRGSNKDIFPLLWDVSVAGHIAAGEAIEISALREIKEEIGLTIHMKQLKKIGVFKSIQKHHPNIIDHEFHHTYLCELKLPITKLQNQISEIADLKLISIDKIIAETSDPYQRKKYVPHDLKYYQNVFTAIKKSF